jgi:hypothetical protein
VKDELKYSDLRMLKNYFTGKRSTQGIDTAVDNAIKYRKFPEGYSLLKEKDKLDFQKRFTAQYLEKQQWDESLKPKQLLGELAAKGIVVRLDVNDNAILGLHGFDKRVFQKASASLNEYLKEVGYKKSYYDQVNKILDEHTKGLPGNTSGPKSIALTKGSPAEREEKSIDEKAVDRISDNMTVKQGVGNKDTYGEATHKIGKKKKRKRGIL